ncbi:MAG: hypothetical protein AB3N10_14755 [Allomuricauda sp.]
MEVIDLNKNGFVTSKELPHFKLKKFEMKTGDGYLRLNIVSPYLTSDNYTVNLSKGVLTIGVMRDHLSMSPNGKTSLRKRFSRAFFTLPDISFRNIETISYTDNVLSVTLSKDKTTHLVQTPFARQLATA